MRRIAYALLLSFLALPSAAQTVTVTANNILGINGQPLGQGFLCYTPVSVNLAPQAFTSNGKQYYAEEKCWRVFAGVATGVMVPDTSQTNPAIGYLPVIRDQSRKPIQTYAEPYYPTALFNTFDTWQPSSAPLALGAGLTNFGTSAPTGLCTSPSFGYLTDSTLYLCGNDQRWHSITSSGGVTSSNIVTALGYTPTSPTTLAGAIASVPAINSANIIAGLGYTPVSPTTLASTLAAIPTVTGTNVISALGYTPTSPTTLASAIAAGVTPVDSSHVVSALGYTPTSPASLSSAIATVPAINSANVIAALGYTPLSPAGGTITGPVYGPAFVLPYDVRSFGAFCDGSHDDSPAFQAAVNAAQTVSGSSPGVVLIPAGNNCKLNSTINIAGYVTVEGVGPKIDSGRGGSGLIYAGTGDAFLVQDTLPTNYTYAVSFKNLNFSASAAATSFIHFRGINGPSYVTNNNFEGNWAATSAVVYDTPSAGWQVILADNFFAGFVGNEVVAHGYNNIRIQHNQFFASRAAGLYLTNSVGEIAGNYFELMPTGIEVTNDDENHFQLDIHGNLFQNGQTPGALPDPVGNATNTSSQRCILVKSTTNGLPFYGQGSISHNQCDLSLHTQIPTLQGIAPYGIDFETASNTFYVNQTWEVEDNSISGTTTAGIYNDSSAVNVSYRDVNAITVWTPGSITPVALPAVAGPGTFTGVGSGASAVAPTFSITSGTYSSAQTLTLSDATGGAAISYCVNPTGNCTPNIPYSAGITIGSSETVCANALSGGGGVVSATSCNSYIINTGSPITPTNTGIGTVLFQSYLTDGSVAYKTCYVGGSVCSGGVGSIAPSSVPTHTFGLNTPSASTGSANKVGNFHLELGTTSGFGEALWTTTGGGVGANATPTNYYVGGWMKANFATGAWRLEFDPYAFDSGWDWMFGTQCNGDNNLIQTANQTSSWTNTPAPCAKLHDGNYHLVEMTFHRTLAADRSCAGGTAPCATWDTISIDGTSYALNVTMPATTSSWAGSGWQFQIDGKPTTASGGSPAVYNLWCDSCQFIAGTAASGGSLGGNGGTTAGTGDLDTFNFDGGMSVPSGLTSVGSPAISASQSHTAANSAHFASGNNYLIDTINPVHTIYSRQYVYVNAENLALPCTFLRYYHGGSELFVYYFATSGFVSYFDQATGASVTAGTSAITTGGWHLIETYTKIDATAGHVTVKIDGTQVYNSGALNTGTATVDTVWFGNIGNTAPTGWDTYQDNVDFDDTGFIGPI